VPLELAEDRRDRERRERGLARRVEPVDRLQQPERRDLDEVVELLAAALIAPGQLACQGQEAGDQLLARDRIAVAVLADQQPPVLAGADGPVIRGRVTWGATALANLFGSIVDALHAHHHAAL
jgi:hypothetical protein